MSFSGGVYTLPGPALTTGEIVSATENNSFRNDVATAFNLTFLRNGTSTATANLPMGGYKLTGLGVATTSGDALSYGQAAVVSSLTNSALTSGRVPFASTGGLLADNAAFTFDGTTLSSTKFAGALNGTVGATTPAAGTFTSLSDSGNLTFTGTGNRITGDFSNATVANQIAFQSSTTNGATSVNAIPNGTAGIALFRVWSNPDATNASFGDIRLTDTTDFRVTSSRVGTGTYLPMTFYTGGSERMRIDTSGNVGIGTNSPLNVSGYTSFNVYNGTNGAIIRAFDTSVDMRMQTAGSAAYFGTFSNSPLAFYTNSAERMRIDAGGNVTVGTSVNNVLDQIASGRPLVVQSASSSTTINGSSNSITICNSDTTTSNTSQLNFAAITGASANQYSSAVISAIHGARVNGQYPAGQLVFSTSTTTNSAPTEKMRIDSSGNLLVGTTSAVGKVVAFSNSDAVVGRTMANNANSAFVGMNTSGSPTFYVSGAGQIYSTSSSIINISDRSLKENITDLNTGLAEVMALKPRRFDWVEGEGTGEKGVVGFIAQEVSDVLPDLVCDYKYSESETKKSLKMGDMVPTLVKAIQELKAEVDALKAAAK